MPPIQLSAFEQGNDIMSWSHLKLMPHDPMSPAMSDEMSVYWGHPVRYSGLIKDNDNNNICQLIGSVVLSSYPYNKALSTLPYWHLSIYIYIYIYLYIYIYIYIYMCVCVYVCVWVGVYWCTYSFYGIESNIHIVYRIFFLSRYCMIILWWYNKILS